MIWILIVILRLFIWRRQFQAYVQAMPLYRQKNWKGLREEPREMMRATATEFFEIFEELAKGKFWDAFLEIFDVWHGVVNTIFVMVFGELMMTKYPYIIIYPLCLFTAWKHGDRYLNGKKREKRLFCIRSGNWHEEDGTPIDHVCCGE